MISGLGSLSILIGGLGGYFDQRFGHPEYFDSRFSGLDGPGAVDPVLPLEAFGGHVPPRGAIHPSLYPGVDLGSSKY